MKLTHASIDFVFWQGTRFEIVYFVRSKYSTHRAKLQHGVIMVRVQTGNQSKAQKSVQNIIYKLLINYIDC